MSFSLELADKPVKKFLKLALYGGPGTGKTFIALSFPDVVVVDTESGTDFYRGRVAPFRVIKTKDFVQVMEVVGAIEEGQLTCGTLVMDSFTILNDVLRESAFKAAEKRAVAKGIAAMDATVTPRDWGKIKQTLNSLMTRLYNLPCNTVITGWIKDQYEGEGNDLKKIGTMMDADKKILHQPDLVLQLDVLKGKHVAFVKKDRTGTWAVDQRLTDVSYVHTFQTLVEGMAQGETTSTPMATEEEAANRGTRLFEDPGLNVLRDILTDTMHLSESDAFWLLTAKLKTPITDWTQVPPKNISMLVDSLSDSDPASIREFVAKNKKGA